MREEECERRNEGGARRGGGEIKEGGVRSTEKRVWGGVRVRTGRGSYRVAGGV